MTEEYLRCNTPGTLQHRRERRTPKTNRTVGIKGKAGL
jgi:hypothetical protein